MSTPGTIASPGQRGGSQGGFGNFFSRRRYRKAPKKSAAGRAAQPPAVAGPYILGYWNTRVSSEVAWFLWRARHISWHAWLLCDPAALIGYINRLFSLYVCTYVYMYVYMYVCM
jgi:hypothetical protein